MKLKTLIPVALMGVALAACATAPDVTSASEPASLMQAAEGPETPIQTAMAFFVGSCWDGVFSDGLSTDRHCLRPMNKGQFVRDRHIVGGARGPYGGETVFSWNAEKNRIDYVYFDTSGAKSEGSLHQTDSGFAAPNEVYDRGNGQSMIISSVWLITGPDSWEQRTLDVSGDTPKPLWTIAYDRAPLGIVEGLD